MRFPIITFHSIDDSGSVISTPRAGLARIVEDLATAGWRGCTLSDALAAWRRGDGGERLVALSFDDGYRNVLRHALPLLSDAGFSATVFVITERCGEDNLWAGQDAAIPAMELLGWPELDELLSAGWEVGAHGCRHLALPPLSREQVRRELRQARDILERRLSVDVPLFAYPYGAHDDTVRELARDVYEGACGTRLALATPADLRAPFELPRIDAYYLRGFAVTDAIDSFIGRGYLAVRRWGRALRRASRRSPTGG